MLLIKNGYVIDPKTGEEGYADVLTEGDKIKRIAEKIEPADQGCQVIREFDS